jgi:hypothetical protein
MCKRDAYSICFGFRRPGLQLEITICILVLLPTLKLIELPWNWQCWLTNGGKYFFHHMKTAILRKTPKKSILEIVHMPNY